MTDKNETVPRPTFNFDPKGNNATVSATNNLTGITSTSKATTKSTTTTVVGGDGNYWPANKYNSGSNLPSSSSSSPLSSQRKKKNSEDSVSGNIRHQESVFSSPGGSTPPPSYQYEPHHHHSYSKQQSSSPSSSVILTSHSSMDHSDNVTALNADYPDGKITSHLHRVKKHGRTSILHQQQHHLGSRTTTQSPTIIGDIDSCIGNEYKDDPAPTSDVQEAIRNLLTSVDTASSISSSPPPSGHHQTTSRSSSSSSPTRYTPSNSTGGGGGGTPKISHKKILPPSPIVVDSPSRTPRRKLDGGVGVTIGSGSSGGVGGPKSAPTYSYSPPVVPPHASSCPSPPSLRKYTTAAGESLSMKKDDIVLPPTRSTASVRARSCQKNTTSAITTVASSVVSSSSIAFSSSSPSAGLEPHSPRNKQFLGNSAGFGYGSVEGVNNSQPTTTTTTEFKDKNSSVDKDSSGNNNVPLSNFYKTRQKLADISDAAAARPKCKSPNSRYVPPTSGAYLRNIKRGAYSTIIIGSNRKKSGYYGYNHGVYSGGIMNSHKNSNYNRGYRSLEKENNSAGNYGGYVTGYNNTNNTTVGSCGLGVDQNTSRDKDDVDDEQLDDQSLLAEGKPYRFCKDQVYYTADRPSRRNMPTTGGSSHRASSVPARRSMSVSEFAGTSVDPEPENGQSDSENLEKVKSKLMSMWNNVKYGWTLNRKTSFRYDSPIFLLGEHYHRRHDDESDGKTKEDTPNRVNNMELFKLDFASRLWFTYRRDFEPLKGTKLTTDCGWGCMIRSGQMMLAQAFVTHFFGRSWRIQNRDRGLNVYRQIIKWFADYQQCPFSVHQLVEIGATLGRKPGEWYGPATVATMLREAMERSYEYQPVLRELCVYVASDCTVYLQEVADICMSGNNNTLVKMPNGSDAEDASVDACVDMPETSTAGSWKCAVIVLIPVRLGGESLNSVYIPCLQNLLAEEHCIGIIGGKPKHSLYFVGWQDEKLIYLDPHYCQDNVDVMSGDFTFSSFHCITPRKLPFEDMDPSCTIGFYCRNQEEFEKFVNQTRDLATNPKQKGLYPAFAFVDGRSCDLEMDKLELNKERYLRIRYVDQDGKQKLPVNENDDFVVL